VLAPRSACLGFASGLLQAWLDRANRTVQTIARIAFAETPFRTLGVSHGRRSGTSFRFSRGGQPTAVDVSGVTRQNLSDHVRQPMRIGYFLASEEYGPVELVRVEPGIERLSSGPTRR
jgi:hypothetical protein